MTTEQRRPSEPMSSAEQGKATFCLQKDFIAGERNVETYIDALHKWRVGDLYPTEFGSPRGTVSYEVDNKTFQVQMGVHYTGPNTGTLSNLERTLKVRIIEDVLNSNNIASTNHTVVSVNSGYLAKIKSNELVEHTEGKVKVFRNGNQVELDEGDPATYEYLRELLAPVIEAGVEKQTPVGVEKVVDAVARSGPSFNVFDALDRGTIPPNGMEFDEEDLKKQLGATGWPGSDAPLPRIPGR